MVDDWAGGELATALRRMVFASERYRLRVARALMGMGATEMIALGLLAVDGACTPNRAGRSAAVEHRRDHRVG
jgi:hypothetical protein